MLSLCKLLPPLLHAIQHLLAILHMLIWLHICSLVFICKSILHSWQEPQFPHWLSSLSMGYLIYFLLKTTEICFHSQLKSECLSCTLEKMKQPVDCGLGGRLSKSWGRCPDSGKAVKCEPACTVSHPLQVCLWACCNPRDSVRGTATTFSRCSTEWNTPPGCCAWWHSCFH